MSVTFYSSLSDCYYVPSNCIHEHLFLATVTGILLQPSDFDKNRLLHNINLEFESIFRAGQGYYGLNCCSQKISACISLGHASKQDIQFFIESPYAIVLILSLVSDRFTVRRTSISRILPQLRSSQLNLLKI